MDILEIRRGERCQVFELLDDEFTIGCGDGDRLRVLERGVGPHELRVTRGESGFRVRPDRDGARLVVNGVATKQRELRHGDRLALGGVTIAFREEGKPWPVEPEPVTDGLDLKIGPIAAVAPTRAKPRAGPHEARGPAPRDATLAARARARSAAPRWLWWNLLLVGGVLALLWVRSVVNAPREPNAGDLVHLAESQHRSLDHEAALATLALAEERFPADPLRPRIEELRRTIRAAMERALDRPAIRRAQFDRDELARVIAFHLAKGPHRPAARELHRLATAWLRNHAELAARSAEVDAMKREVEGWIATHGPAAALGEPDRVEDVVFAAERRLRFELRRYVEAIAILETWLGGAGATAAEADRRRVRELLAAWRTEGPVWVAGRRATIERMIEAGQRDRAREELATLVEGGLVPTEWLGDAAARLAALRG